VYLDARDQGDFMLSRAGWLGDYADPLTFLDMFMTGGGNNNTNWGDEVYDDLITKVRADTDQSKRFEMMHQMEGILMRDMPIMPIYFYTDPYMFKPWVKGVQKPFMGPDIEFKWGYVEQ